MRAIKTITCAGVSTAALFAGAIAQPAAAQTGGATMVEEVLVTARRVEENLQQTPVSVAAVTAEQLERTNVTSLVDLTRVVPAIRFQGEGNLLATAVSIRGLGRAPVGTGGPAVEIYFADVPISGSPLPTYDLANIQVLRGPQGTLFGRNTIGGAILVSPAAPTFEMEGYAKVTAGNHEYYALEGSVNLPLVADRAALRVAGQLRRREAYTDNLGVGPDFDDLHSDAVRASLLLSPTDTLRNTTIFDYFRADEVGPATITYGLNQPSIFPCPAACVTAINQAIAVGPEATINGTINPFPFAYRKFYGVFNTTIFDATDHLTFKNIIAYRNRDQTFRIDNDGTAFPILSVTSQTRDQVFTEEFQVVGDAMDDRLRWILGGFYGKTTPAGRTGAPATPPAAQTASYNTTATTKAAFINVDFDITDKLTFNVGYRYSWDKQNICTARNAVTTFFGEVPTYSECKAFAASPANTTADGRGIISTKGEAPTWTVGLNYQATDDLFFYAVARRGYRAGGVNSPIFETACTTGNPACDNLLTPTIPADGAEIDLRPFQFIDNEFLTDAEIGMRSDWTLGGWRQRFNVTLWRYVWENVLGRLSVNCQVLDPGCPAFPAVGLNTGEVTAKGIEMDLILQPTQDLTFFLNAALSDMDQTEPGTAPPGVGPPGFGGVPPANRPLPKFAGTVAVRYTLPFRPLDGELTFSADYFHTDSFEAQETLLPGYDIANARLDWRNINGGGLSFAIWGRNIFDEEYIASPSSVGGAVGGQPALLPYRAANYGEPRMFGIEATYRWGQ